MPKLDFVLLIVFGTITVFGLAGAALAFRQSLKVANQKDGDLKMFLWAVATMIGLIIGGMSAAYILLPILFSL